jgi:hypothetical protein
MPDIVQIAGLGLLLVGAVGAVFTNRDEAWYVGMVGLLLIL